MKPSATPLLSEQIAEIALMLSQNIGTTDIEKLFQLLPLRTASRRSLKSTYQNDHALWLFSGISEALETRKGVDSPAIYLSQTLHTLGKASLAVKITDITSHPVDTQQQPSVSLSDLLTIENKPQLTSKLEQPLLVGLLSGLSPKVVYQIRHAIRLYQPFCTAGFVQTPGNHGRPERNQVSAGVKAD